MKELSIWYSVNQYGVDGFIIGDCDSYITKEKVWSFKKRMKEEFKIFKINFIRIYKKDCE